MEQKNKNNVKLGAFVLAGVVLLMCMLYYVGKNENKWASGVEVSVHFSQLSGLEEGGNVLYAGMPAGSVKAIRILNDTTIEVEVLINKKTSPYIHKNALVSIGSEGLMGNKVVNITPVPGNYPLIADGDLLASQESGGFDKMLPKMARIGDNVTVIAATLRKTVVDLDSSELLRLLKDRRTAVLLLQSLEKLNNMTDNVASASMDVRGIAAGIRSGKGTIGQLLRDTVMSGDLKAAASELRATVSELRSGVKTIDDLSRGFKEKITSGSGLFNVILTDTAAANNLRASLSNIRRGTDNFNQDMEALQHNFLLRRYFRKRAADSSGKTAGSEAH